MRDPTSRPSVPANTVLAMARPTRLPRGEQARIPTEKLVRYVLDPTDQPGATQGARLCFSPRDPAADWRYLHDQILEVLPNATVRTTRITSFGVAYEVVVMIDGLNGASARSSPRGSPRATDRPA